MRRLIPSLAAPLLLISSALTAAELAPHRAQLRDTLGCQDWSQLSAAGEPLVELPFNELEAAMVCESSSIGGSRDSIVVLPIYGFSFACPELIEGDFPTGILAKKRAVVALEEFHTIGNPDDRLPEQTSLKTILTTSDGEREAWLICLAGEWFIHEHAADGVAEHDHD